MAKKSSGRKRTPSQGNRSKLVSLLMSKHMYEAFLAVCKREERTLSGQIRFLISERLAAEEEDRRDG